MRMVRDGELPHVKVGSHTRLRTDDVFAARDRRLQRKREALQELIELEDSLGL